MKNLPQGSPVKSFQMREKKSFRNHSRIRDFQNNIYLGEEVDTD